MDPDFLEGTLDSIGLPLLPVTISEPQVRISDWPLEHDLFLFQNVYDYPNSDWKEHAHALNREFTQSPRTLHSVKTEYDWHTRQGVTLRRMQQWARPETDVLNFSFEEEVWLLQTVPLYKEGGYWPEVQAAFNRNLERDVDFEVLKSHYRSKIREGYTLDIVLEGEIPRPQKIPRAVDDPEEEECQQEISQDTADVSNWPLEQDIFVLEAKQRDFNTNWAKEAVAFNRYFGTILDPKSMWAHYEGLDVDEDKHHRLMQIMLERSRQRVRDAATS